MSARRSGPYGIGFATSRGGAIARASASTAPACLRTPAGGSAPPGSSTTNARVAREGRVLPRDGRAVVARQRPARQPGLRRVEPLELRVARALHHDPERLVVPERHARALALDEALHHLRLRLGGRPGTRLVDAVLRLPAVREVAVQVDPVRVVARVRGRAVRIRVVHEPERGAARRVRPPQPGDHGAAGLLVAVDRADRRAPSRARGRSRRAARGSGGPARSARSSPTPAPEPERDRRPPPRPPRPAKKADRTTRPSMAAALGSIRS